MKLYSRLTGICLSVEQDITLSSGLYELMEDNQSNKRKILFDDGTGGHQVDKQTVTFDVNEQHQGTEDKITSIAALAVAYDAITHINSKFQIQNLTGFSHLLPPEIAKFIARTELDQSIEQSFEYGIFQTINQSPRMSMRYDVELLATSRVKRYASNYQTHLVAHSECWQQRTFTGIIPKKLMAKVSEDEIKIYENVVYARLIDHLLHYLAGAQARLNQILNIIKAFNNLDAEGKGHHFITQISKDWGRAFNEKSISLLKEQSIEQINFVNKYRSKLIQMKNAALYRSIPQNIQVGISLKPTNILMHDENYQRMASVWRTWSKLSFKERLNSAQVIDQKQQQQKEYYIYVVMIVKQIFDDIGWQTDSQMSLLNIDNGLELVIEQHELGVLNITYNGMSICRIVVLAEPLCGNDLGSNKSLFTHQNNPIVLITPQLIYPQNRIKVVELSPLNLLGKERLASVLVQSIWKWAFVVFNASLPDKVPTLIQKELPENHKLITPLTQKQVDLVNNQNKSNVSKCIRAKNVISHFIRCCPYCTQKAKDKSFTINENGDFKGSCDNKECRTVWIHQSNQAEYFVVNNGSDSGDRYTFSLSSD